jgi:hypothetical protein
MTTLDTAELVIRLGIGLNMVAFGVHQIVKPSEWLEYVPRFLRWMLPIKPESFLRSHGILNYALGLWLMIGWAPIIATSAAIIWWVSILPFAFMVKWSIALRDVSIICALVGLLLLCIAKTA